MIGGDAPDIPFFRGLIARGSGDLEEAVRQFDRFLELAPDDPRATMVQGLRDEAGGRLAASVQHALQRGPQGAQLGGGNAIEEVLGHAAKVGRRGAPQALIAPPRSAAPTGRAGRCRS